MTHTDSLDNVHTDNDVHADETVEYPNDKACVPTTVQVGDVNYAEQVAAKSCSPWLPPQLRTPSASGARGDIKFAFFAEKRRLLIEYCGEFILYDCGDHQISAIRARFPELESWMFTSQTGERSLAELRRLN